MKILRNSLLVIIIAAMAWMFAHLFMHYNPRSELNPVATYYAEKGLAETGAANLVTSVVVTYRGLDTLGEVTILFLTAAIIGLMLKAESEKKRKPVHQTSEFLVTASRVLIPAISLFGIYIFMNGHLTPGGGFQGGAILASAFILLLMAGYSKNIGHRLLDITESISGFAFVLLGILGIALAGGFLDNKVFGLGTFGSLFSAGAIPVIYSFVGLKVGAELSNIILEMNRLQGEKAPGQE